MDSASITPLSFHAEQGRTPMSFALLENNQRTIIKMSYLSTFCGETKKFQTRA